MKRNAARLFVLSTIVALVAFGAAGCFTPRLSTVTVNGEKRSYLLHVPTKAPGTPMPLVLALHQFTDTPKGMESLTGFSALADEEGFLVAYPKGMTRTWNSGMRDAPDDVAFLEALIDDVAARQPVDPTRVYACGISAGGMMSQWLACRSDRFAAVAALAGSLTKDAVDRITGPRNVPVFLMHGTEDPVVPYAGGETYAGPGMRPVFLSAAEAGTFWGEKNGCGDRTEIRELTPLDPKDPTRVVRYSPACPAALEVVRYSITGGGHTWPGHANWYPAFIVGPTSMQIDATREIWAFFRRHQRPHG